MLSFPTCVAEERDSPFSSPMGLRKHPTAYLSSNHSQDIMSASMKYEMQCALVGSRLDLIELFLFGSFTLNLFKVTGQFPWSSLRETDRGVSTELNVRE